jgi:hypothetical protein
VWVTHTERRWIRGLEAEALADVAQAAEARFAAVTCALTMLLADTRAVPMLRRLGITRVAWGRSARLAENGRAEGLAVLEGMVLAAVIGALLMDADLVRWMSAHHPKALALLHGIAP